MIVGSPPRFRLGRRWDLRLAVRSLGYLPLVELLPDPARDGIPAQAFPATATREPGRPAELIEP